MGKELIVYSQGFQTKVPGNAFLLTNVGPAEGFNAIEPRTAS